MLGTLTASCYNFSLQGGNVILINKMILEVDVYIAHVHSSDGTRAHVTC